MKFLIFIWKTDSPESEESTTQSDVYTTFWKTAKKIEKTVYFSLFLGSALTL